MKKFIFTSALFMTMALMNINSAKAADGIGIVDNAKLSSEYYKAVEAQKLADEYQSKLKNLVKTETEDLQRFNNNSANTEAQKIEKQKAAQKKVTEERQRVEVALQKLREEIFAEIKQAINDESSAQSLSLVLPANVPLYGGKDITDAVVKRLNENKTKEASAKVAPTKEKASKKKK